MKNEELNDYLIARNDEYLFKSKTGVGMQRGLRID